MALAPSAARSRGRHWWARRRGGEKETQEEAQQEVVGTQNAETRCEGPRGRAARCGDRSPDGGMATSMGLSVPALPATALLESEGDARPPPGPTELGAADVAGPKAPPHESEGVEPGGRDAALAVRVKSCQQSIASVRDRAVQAGLDGADIEALDVFFQWASDPFVELDELEEAIGILDRLQHAKIKMQQQAIPPPPPMPGELDPG